ncbi:MULTISPECIES: C40 family peptidase [unclassified Paenibacillus]|uniref:C40 family peptidase n=1 Tax=unclassified Paenibacillus TaxID=185978 RepID=UPI0009556F04|nr:MULTISPECIES: C40 family peptidase [unclassified Paenibacillus]ASS68515.1 C40 family peptidase [Paenibacillus sp. RUD330]SIR35814.1 Cell wall-associated hydrolase, NlpC family [Paenibacillus sp. RU4X]SIR46493.1 Cell wall-associated hydrolase, NlpC family [Paenibacillus sp. RU4T]
MTFNFNQLTKKIAAAALALSIAISGGALLSAPKAEAATASASSKATTVINAAKAQMGTPYKFGASTSTTKYFDCSSLMKYAYKKAGITLPRTSKAQSKVGKYVSKSNLKPGDLVFFYSPVTHVGMYIGGGKIVHTYGKPGVTTDTINSGWWKDHYNTARRVL